MSLRALRVRPRGKQRYIRARATVRVLFDLYSYPPDLSCRTQEHGRRTVVADVDGGDPGPGIAAPESECGHEAEKGASSRTHFVNLI